MDSFETPYEDDAPNDFIECTVCDKSIRGKTLYKIHLTSPGHIKSQVLHWFTEECYCRGLSCGLFPPNCDLFSGGQYHQLDLNLSCAQFSSATVMMDFVHTDTTFWIPFKGILERYEEELDNNGLGVREHNIPVFEDILQYLDYLKLDEPIIGLSYLEEVPSSLVDPYAGPRYTCKLCTHTSNLPDMVHHVIGRKHRQKYVELKRPDLVTWDKQSIITQGGKIIRARAEIIERQDGRGTPLPMKKKGIIGKLNISRVPPTQKPNEKQNFPRSLSQFDLQSKPPELPDSHNEYSLRGRCPPGYPNTTQFPRGDPHMLNPDRQMCPWEETLRCDRMEEKLGMTDDREKDMYRRQYKDPDYRSEYKGEYVRDPQTREGVPRFDSREEMPHSQHEYYPEKAPLFSRPQPEKDPLKEFYTEEVRRGRVCSAEYQPSQQGYPKDDERRWSLDRESSRPININGAGRQGSNEPETKRRILPTLMGGDQTRQPLIRDYRHEIREQHQAELIAGLNRTGPMEVNRSMSDIPEPFRRFLKVAVDDESHGKRKRKSRFSDATVEELETANQMFGDQCGPPNPKFGGHSRPGREQFEPEVHGANHHPDIYTQSKSSHYTDSYQRGGSEGGGILDMLKDIEIENAEEANFLKDKLCNLLKEFKAKKSEKALQKAQGNAVISKDYDSLKPDLQPSQRHLYERTLREDSDSRRPEDLYFEEDRRGRGWQQQDHMNNERLQEYQHPVRGDPSQSSRSRFEEVFARSEMERTHHATQPDERARFPERFQEHVQTHGYRPTAGEVFDSRRPPPLLNMERGPRMLRGPQYSSNLDKITSTLLELVARK